MSQERKFNLTEYQTNGQPLASTGICAVDAVLQLMYQRALQEQIDYNLRITENIKTTALQSLSEEDFSHLLADLIENAFIAMSDVADKKFLSTLGEWEITCLLKFPTTDSRFHLKFFRTSD